MCKRNYLTEKEKRAIKTMVDWIEYEKKHKENINRAEELIEIQETILYIIFAQQCYINNLKKGGRRNMNMVDDTKLLIDEETQNKIDKEILELVHNYVKDNYVGSIIGADYIDIDENDEDIILDAINLVKQILEVYADNNEVEVE